MRTKLIGLGLLILVILSVFLIKNMQTHQMAQVTLKGYVGSEKLGLLADPDFVKILKDKYGVTLDYTSKGSISMVQGNTSNVDFLFPSSQTALDLFKETKGGQLVNSQVIFNSPIVLYSWDTVTDGLIKQGIVREMGDSYYIVDMPKLVDLVNSGKQWSDIGVPGLYGKVMVISTDPTQSNSGNMFAGLLANILNNGEVVDSNSVKPILPKLKAIFDRMGYLESGSGDLFNQYITTGEGAKPIIAGYESQLIEFAVQNPAQWQQVKGRLRILYPQPTVWSSHPFMALDSKATVVISALSDPEIQKLAWEKHGFRSGIVGIQNDPKVLDIAGIPDTINQIIPMPTPDVMLQIINAVSTN